MDKSQSLPNWAQVAVNTAEIENVKEHGRKLDDKLEKFMERMEEKLDEMNATMNSEFKTMNSKIDLINKKQMSLESKLQGGWWVICALGATLIGALSFLNSIHDWIVK